MRHAVDELWNVAQGAPHVDAAELAHAIEGAAASGGPLDYRTRLLVRDGLHQLEAHWGHTRFRQWLDRSPQRSAIEAATDPRGFDDAENRGFNSLFRRRIVDVVTREAVERFFRDLSSHIATATRLVVGGSIALTMADRLSRHTDDVDLVDEVPADLRAQHDVLEELTRVHGLRLTHFQSHYLPDGWEPRVRSIGVYGNLHVFGVDPIDVFVGKLFSVRVKDREDLNALVSQLNHDAIRERVTDCTTGLRSDPRLLDAARKNWFVLFGENELPG